MSIIFCAHEIVDFVVILT